MSEEMIILTEDQNSYLESLCEDYNIACEEFTSFDNKKKALNSLVKQTFSDYGITKFKSKTGLSYSITSRPNISWDEDSLLSYCAELGFDGLVKTKEYVDFDVLESLIYNNKIQASELKQFQTQKPDIVTLRVTQKKTLNE